MLSLCCAYVKRWSMRSRRRRFRGKNPHELINSDYFQHADARVVACRTTLLSTVCTLTTACRARLPGTIRRRRGIVFRGRRAGGGGWGCGRRAGRRCGCRILAGGRIRRLRSRLCSLRRARGRTGALRVGRFRCRWGRVCIGVGRLCL